MSIRNKQENGRTETVSSYDKFKRVTSMNTYINVCEYEPVCVYHSN